jgi:DNA-binding transcriptional ArsR family regulator
MPKRRTDRAIAGAALVFAALGDPTRLALLERLSSAGPASISTLAERFSVSRQAVTKHLYVLAGAGLLDGRREGREHVWAIQPDRLSEARRYLDTIARGWEGALERLKRHLEA